MRVISGDYPSDGIVWLAPTHARAFSDARGLSGPERHLDSNAFYYKQGRKESRNHANGANRAPGAVDVPTALCSASERSGGRLSLPFSVRSASLTHWKIGCSFFPLSG
jgi:hypothetical protein